MNLQFIFLVATSDIVPNHSSHLDTKSVDSIPTHTPTITQSGVDIIVPQTPTVDTTQPDTTALQTDIIIVTGGAVAAVALISITSAVTLIVLKGRRRKNPTGTQERWCSY